MTEQKTSEKTLAPEERFAELVAIREKEKELEHRLQEAREQAAQMIAEARDRAGRMHVRAEQELRRELECRRAEANAATEVEAQKLISEGQALARQVKENTEARQTTLLESLRKELFAQVGY